jgi:hypothetical protein
LVKQRARQEAEESLSIFRIVRNVDSTVHNMNQNVIYIDKVLTGVADRLHNVGDATNPLTRATGVTPSSRATNGLHTITTFPPASPQHLAHRVDELEESIGKRIDNLAKQQTAILRQLEMLTSPMARSSLHMVAPKRTIANSSGSNPDQNAGCAGCAMEKA